MIPDSAIVYCCAAGVVRARDRLDAGGAPPRAPLGIRRQTKDRSVAQTADRDDGRSGNLAGGHCHLPGVGSAHQRRLGRCGGASFLFLVGLIDDWLHIKPYQKLIGQVIGAAVVVNYGLVLPWTRSLPANMVITIFWLIGITNAINLLDNMDGLATGIAAIASAFLTFNFMAAGQTTEAMMLGVFTAALVGFLIYNSNPASIFMGDSGSMFIGFFLASASLINLAGGRSRSLRAGAGGANSGAVHSYF